MKRFTKVALGALLLAGATTAVSASASAGVYVGVGAPAIYGPGPICNPYSPACWHRSASRASLPHRAAPSL
jgi:hypothetical protein